MLVYSVKPLVISALCSLIIISASFIPAKRYYVNVSPSVPPGIYSAHSPKTISVGDMVIFEPPQGVHIYIYGRKWLPKGWPLIKYVGGVSGDTYDIKKGSFYINNKYVGPVADKDTGGLPLPKHEGTWTVPKGEFLPVSTHITNSFDGRYFGTVPISKIQKILEPQLISGRSRD